MAACMHACSSLLRSCGVSRQQWRCAREPALDGLQEVDLDGSVGGKPDAGARVTNVVDFGKSIGFLRVSSGRLDVWTR